MLIPQCFSNMLKLGMIKREIDPMLEEKIKNSYGKYIRSFSPYSRTQNTLPDQISNIPDGAIGNALPPEIAGRN